MWDLWNKMSINHTKRKRFFTIRPQGVGFVHHCWAHSVTFRAQKKILRAHQIYFVKLERKKNSFGQNKSIWSLIHLCCFSLSIQVHDNIFHSVSLMSSLGISAVCKQTFAQQKQHSQSEKTFSKSWLAGIRDTKTNAVGLWAHGQWDYHCAQVENSKITNIFIEHRIDLFAQIKWIFSALKISTVCLGMSSKCNSTYDSSTDHSSVLISGVRSHLSG